MSAETVTGGILRRKHGQKKYQQQVRIGQLRDALRITSKFCPKNVRESVAPLLSSQLPAMKSLGEDTTVDVRQNLWTNIAIRLQENLSSKGFFSRIAWAVKYVFVGVGGAE